MILTAHQPVYLPWLGLFHKIALADVYVFMDDVKYSKSDYSNRNYIKHPANKKQWLTIPLKTGGSDNIRFDQLEIDNTQNWQRKHIATMRNFYKDAPYIKDYYDMYAFYEREYTYLVEITFDMLLYFLDKLGIRTAVKRASEYNLNSKGNDYLIDLCKRERCNVYIFGALGIDYASTEQFKREGITPYFQNYNHPRYPQLHGDFLSHLSIVDLLFNCGPSSLEILMQGNTTKEELKASLWCTEIKKGG